jgi:hypothetical protein
LTTANQNAEVDDVIYLLDTGGNYYNEQINPSNSGTSWNNKITFIAYAGHTPTFTSNQTGLFQLSLTSQDYIKVSGITFRGYRGFSFTNGSNYNELYNCIFYPANSYVQYSYNFIGGDMNVGGYTPSNYNWIHGCTFREHAKQGTCSDDGSLLRIVSVAGDDAQHNAVTDNVFYYGGHDLIDIGGSYNIIRNNIAHNEAAYVVASGSCNNTSTNGYFGNRNFYTQDYATGGWNGPYKYGRNMIEGNRLGHAGLPPDDDGAFALELDSGRDIVRYNYLFGSDASGINLKDPSSSDNNRIYHNTFYYNGHGPSQDITDHFRAAICDIVNGAADNVIKNNLVYGTNLAEGKDFNDGGVPSRLADDTYDTNWLSTDSDPKFVNTSMSDKTSLVLPDLTLQSGSPCIDYGTYLTQADGGDGGSPSTSLTVDDPYYFQDGSWGPPGVLEADWIAVGAIDNTVEISSINFSTGIITLASAIEWDDNDSIWLYKKSDGEVVLYGDAPEVGAYEYPPTSLSGSFRDERGNTVTGLSIYVYVFSLTGSGDSTQIADVVYVASTTSESISGIWTAFDLVPLTEYLVVFMYYGSIDGASKNAGAEFMTTD